MTRVETPSKTTQTPARDTLYDAICKDKVTVLIMQGDSLLFSSRHVFTRLLSTRKAGDCRYEQSWGASFIQDLFFGSQ